MRDAHETVIEQEESLSCHPKNQLSGIVIILRAMSN
jgi:hypothetical protein